MKGQLDGQKVIVNAKIGEDGQLFGSVTSTQIVDALKSQLGVEIDRKRIARGATIKTAGRHNVEVNLYRDITAKIIVQVGPEASVEPEPKSPADAVHVDEQQTVGAEEAKKSEQSE